MKSWTYLFFMTDYHLLGFTCGKSVDPANNSRSITNFFRVCIHANFQFDTEADMGSILHSKEFFNPPAEH